MRRESRRTRWVLTILLALSLTLVTLDLRGGESPDGVRGFAAGLLAPLQSASAALVRPVQTLFTNIGEFGSQADRIKALQAANDKLAADLRATDDIRARAAELDSLLKIAARGQYRTVVAQVIAIGPVQSLTKAVVIDAGSMDGLTKDMTVINGDGLVGRIWSVTKSTATVQLLIDPGATVGARLERRRAIGFLSGDAKLGLSMSVLDPFVTISPHDRVVTFGSTGGKPYVAGVPIGEVMTVKGTPGQQTRIAQIAPYVDFSTLDVVGVVVEPPRVDPRDSVLPPLPASTVSPTTTPSTSSPSGSPTGLPTGSPTGSPGVPGISGSPGTSGASGTRSSGSTATPTR